MKDFELIFYKKPNGECPVSDFLMSLNKVMRFKMLHAFDLLELHGNNPKGDFSKPVQDGIFEVRAQNKTDITRVLFFFDKNRQIILTNGFIKKTQKMPASELETAKKFRADYFARAEERSSAEKSKGQENTRFTIGPQWRPKFDDLVANAQSRKDDVGSDFNRQTYDKKISPHSR